MIVERPRWFLIVGPDIYDNDWGLTLGYGPIMPDGIGYAWRRVWRINVRWPLSVRRSQQRRFAHSASMSTTEPK